MLGRVIIDVLGPRTPSGAPAKAAVGEHVAITAEVYRDGHDIVAARVRWRPKDDRQWRDVLMTPSEPGLDRWTATIVPDVVGAHEFRVEAWTDRFATWRHDAEIKSAAGDPELEVVFEEGARLLDRLGGKVAKDGRAAVKAAAAALRDTGLGADERLTAGLDEHIAQLLADVPDPIDATRSPSVPLWVDRARGREGGWYEFFPRSEGGLATATKRLRPIAEMGFDVVYLPPIHPIGMTARKGANNTVGAGPTDPGSPWAIGSSDGGHTAIAPELGTIDDFDAFVDEAAANGLEVALDYALQCSPDHPWVREHPEWFHIRADGSIAYAENPPKKYQDIYPINFWPERDSDRVALWNACKDIVDYWIDHGVTIFRVDNPHTKPFAFWDWLIDGLRKEHPDVVLLAEAFTRPAIMAKLAEVGFTQSYTYFTWRTTRSELEEYVDELAQGPTADYMRPNFWPNTPDILSGPLRNGPPAAFTMRYLLAATLSPAYGIYSGYELCENQPYSDTNEEYLHSEKYEVKRRDWESPASIAPFIARVNEVRRAHPAFAELKTVHFHETGNDSLIAYSKTSPGGDVILCVVNLDPFGAQEGVLALDLPELGLGWEDTFDVIDELDGAVYTWTGAHPYVRLDPAHAPGHVLALRRR